MYYAEALIAYFERYDYSDSRRVLNRHHTVKICQQSSLSHSKRGGNLSNHTLQNMQLKLQHNIEVGSVEYPSKYARHKIHIFPVEFLIVRV